MTKKIIFFTAIVFLTLSSCRKEATTFSQDKTLAESQLQTNSVQSASNNNADAVVSNALYSDKRIPVPSP